MERKGSLFLCGKRLKMENNILLTNNDFFLKDDIEGDINQAEEQYSNDNSKMSIAVSLLAIAKIKYNERYNK